MPCPDCKNAGGLPFMASTQAGRPDIVRIGMRCRLCRAEWVFDLPAVPDPAAESN